MTGRARAAAGAFALGAAPLALAGLALAAPLMSAGCDWRQFDAIQSRVPVVSVDAPPGFGTAQDFGQLLLAVTPPPDGSVAGRALVSSLDQTALAAISFDVRGNAKAETLSGAALDNLGGTAVWAMAELKQKRQALLGAPAGSKGTALLLDLDPPYGSTALVGLTESQFGAGVAAGALGGGPADDLVVLSATALHVFVDGAITAASSYYADSGGAAQCPIFLSDALPVRSRADRPVVIASLLGGTAPQIVVGTPSPSGPGAVAIFNADTTAGTASCALTLPAPNGERQFGQALAVADFDGDGIPDLLVGAPPTNAYLYRGPVTASPTAPVAKLAGLSFGSAVAALPVQGKQAAEALIADPDATVGGQMTAGNVSLYAFSATGAPEMLAPTSATTVLADRSPSGSEAYGSAVVALPFCTTNALPRDGGLDGGGIGGGADAGAADAGRADGGSGAACTPVALPLVGTATKVFGYFTVGPFDPRMN